MLSSLLPSKSNRIVLGALLVFVSLRAFDMNAVPSHIHTKSGNAFGAIGFGTNGIMDERVFLEAISAGYRFFDLAETYDNVEIVAAALKKSEIDRREFFINIKLNPTPDPKQFVQTIEKLKDLFDGYLDCVMFHTMPGSIVALENIIEELRPHKGKWFYYLGASNYDMPNEQSLASMIAYNEKLPEERRIRMGSSIAEYERKLVCSKHFDLVQNPHWHQQLDSSLSTCLANGIMHMGYSVFGGRRDSACAVITAFNFNPISFPAINAISQRLMVSPFQLILAYMSRYSFQIPGTTKKERMIENLSMTPEILAQLGDEDFSAIDDDIAMIDNETVLALRASSDWRSRIKKRYFSKASHRLLNHLFADAELEPIFLSLLDAENSNTISSFITFLEEIGHHGRMSGGNDIDSQNIALNRIKSMFRNTPQSELSVFHDYVLRFNPSDFDAMHTEYCSRFPTQDESKF